jgi:succinoglycan biosynthesis protein ExoA
MKVALVVPVLNEAAYIATCLENLLEQLPSDGVIFVADGGSTDSTCTITREIAATDRRVLLIHNPGRIQASAVNLVAKIAHGQYQCLVRADAHSRYPAHYVSTLLRVYRENRTQAVAVPMDTVGFGFIQKAIAAAQNSTLGNGGSAHRRGGCSGLVEHGHHALFDLDKFVAIGGYDASFTHNEDYEFDYRLRLSGGKIWLCREACIEYFPRTTFTALARQYLNYGRGRARTIIKHSIFPRSRQLLPVLILCSSVVSLILSLFWWPAILVPLSYVLLCLSWGTVLALRLREPAALLSGLAAIIMHMSWSLGFLQGLLSVSRPSRICQKLIQRRTV